MDVRCVISGTGSTILILHGWGSSADSWAKAQEMLARKEFRVIVLDLPGFGKTAAPSTVWGVAEYSEFVRQCMQELDVKKCIVVGHSFGGQTAIQLAVTHPENIEKLILMAAAGIRHELGTKAKVLAGVAGVTPAYMKRIAGVLTGRSDYGRSKGIMKDIMRKVIREDLSEDLSKIKTPTLIIWGDKDRETPVQDAYTMHGLILGSKLEIFPGIGHRIRNEAPEKLIDTILGFLI